jgi:hypothetical protein
MSARGQLPGSGAHTHRARTVGAGHPRTLSVRANLAKWTGQAGDAAAARDQFAALLPIREQVSGAEHPDTLSVRDNLARWTRDANHDESLGKDRLSHLMTRS